MMKPNKCVVLALTASFAMLSVACGEDEVMTTNNSNKPKPKASASSSANGGTKAPPIREFGPADFVESEVSRDPFRDFEHLFATKTPEKVDERQRPVKASDFALDELKLTGILSRGRASAMLKDPTGFGWILHTGDFIGKAEMVSVGGTDGNEVPINWKVDRIRGDRVVFIREDPTRPEIPPTTREMPLYAPGEGPGSRG